MDTSSTVTFPRESGSIAYEIAGEGPLVVCVPGMADLRCTFRFLAPALVEAGYRVVMTDLRGHGDSDTTFDGYDNEANASDIEALIEHLGGPAVIIGNSMGAAIGVLTAAHRPELVSGLVLIGPFVRNGKVNAALKAIMRIATAAPVVAATWKGYLPSLYKGTRPDDFEEYRASVIAAIRRPGHRRSVSKAMRTSHETAERLLPKVHTEVLVVMGELDPDFTDPANEAAWIVEQLGGSVVMVPHAGHYPQSQRPDMVNPAVVAFLAKVAKRA